jgi:hypothetical protein
MDTENTTPFSVVYDSFLSKITDDMYMELTIQDTYKMLEELLITSIPKFEFPRVNLFDYVLAEDAAAADQGSKTETPEDNSEEENPEVDEAEDNENPDSEGGIAAISEEDTEDEEPIEEEENTDNTEEADIETHVGYFNAILTREEVNILSTYMIVEWLGQQLASIENVRMKYSGTDFKFTSQANHMSKLLTIKKDYEREGFHLQRLYKRRVLDENGIPRSTMGIIMAPIKPNSNRGRR